MRSTKFKDTRTGEIVTQIPLTQIQHYVEYTGPCEEGEVDDNALNFQMGASAVAVDPEEVRRGKIKLLVSVVDGWDANELMQYAEQRLEDYYKTLTDDELDAEIEIHCDEVTA